MLKQLRGATDSLVEVALYYILLLVISSSVFVYSEGRGWGESIYWAVVTSTTLGYGDINPVTLIGRLDAIFTAFLSVFVVVPMVIVRLVELLSIDRDAWTHDEQEAIKNELSEIKKILEKLDTSPR